MNDATAQGKKTMDKAIRQAADCLGALPQARGSIAARGDFRQGQGAGFSPPRLFISHARRDRRATKAAKLLIRCPCRLASFPQDTMPYDGLAPRVASRFPRQTTSEPRSK